MRCTNISPREEGTRISSKGNPLVGGLHFSLLYVERKSSLFL